MTSGRRDRGRGAGSELAAHPEAGEGDYVIIHAGFAIGVLDREEAEATLALPRAGRVRGRVMRYL